LFTEEKKRAILGIGVETAPTGQLQATRRDTASLPPASFVTNVRLKQKKEIAENRWQGNRARSTPLDVFLAPFLKFIITKIKI